MTSTEPKLPNILGEYICFFACGEWKPFHELVRCKDCKHFHKDITSEEIFGISIDESGFCELLSKTYTSGHFCADGVKCND